MIGAVRTVCVSLAAYFLIGGTTSALAATGTPMEVQIRGKTLSLMIYRPALPPSRTKGTIIMGSGDVGWVGLAVSMSEFLSDQGYIVVGVNVRQYLSSFTERNRHLAPSDEPADYGQIAVFLRGRGLLMRPVILSGMSEGAALSVLAASDRTNHSWVTGVITMGLPATAELAWRWTDFTAWITKKDADEPSFAPRDFIASVSPLPLYMIQSTHDEYVPEADYRELETAARMPKKLALVNAKNHRFTDRIEEIHREFLSAVGWIQAREEELRLPRASGASIQETSADKP